MAKIRFITIEQLLEMMGNKEKFKLVEVLGNESYKDGHIPGAISIPLESLSDAEKQLKKTDKIVVYCASYSCHASTKAAEMLVRMGFKNVLDFKGGKKLWVGSGLELEK